MKLLFLFPILLLVSQIEGDAYVPGYQYTYRFLGKIATGIPGVQRQWSGLAITYRIAIQVRQDHLVFKFDDVKVDRINKHVHNINFHEFDFKPSSEYSEHLTKSFRVYYADGIVKKFYVQRDEPEWSVNFKKATLTMFQVNLRQYNPIRIQKDNYLVKPDPTANYFRVMEDGIGGECETMYNIRKDPYIETPFDNNVLNVTKTKNYANCKYRPFASYSDVYGHKCVECGPSVETNEPFHSYDVTYYNLRGDRYHFLIEKAYTEGESVFTPYTTNGQSIITYVNQTIELTDVKQTTDVIKPDSDVVAVYDLLYKFPKKINFRDLVDLKKPHTIYKNYGHYPEIDEVGQLFNKIAESYKTIDLNRDLTQKYTLKYKGLTDHVATFCYDRISRFYNKYVDYDFSKGTPLEKAKLYLFWDVLKDIGTNPSYIFMQHLTRKDTVPAPIMAGYFNNLVFALKEPTEVLFDNLYRFCSEPSITKHEYVRRSCYQTFASLVNQYCVVHSTVYQKNSGSYRKACTPEITEKYVNYLHQKYEQSHSVEDKTTFIAALGTISTQKTINILKTVIDGKSNNPLHLRTQAVWSLHKLASYYPEEVIGVVSPVFFNDTEDHEVRIAAFSVFIAANPALHHFYYIVKVMQYEKNMHVQNYIYTTLQYLENSTHPCHQKVAVNAKLAFEVLKATNFTPVYSPKYSFRYTMAGYNPKYNYGGFTSISYVASNVSYVPRNVHVLVNDYMAGMSTEPIEIGMRTQGLDKVIDKLFGPEGLFYKSDSLFDILSRKKRSVNSVEKELKEIQDALSLVPREYEPIIGHFYFARYGQYINFFDFNELTFKNFLSNGTFEVLPETFDRLGNGIEYHRQMYTFAVDATLEVPTAFGLSVLLDVKIPTQTSFNLEEVKFKVEPNVFASDRNEKPPKKVTLRVKGRVTTDTLQVITLSVLSPFEKTKYGSGYEHRSIVTVPTNGHVSYDVPTKKLSFEYVPSFEDVFHTHFEPFTFIDSYVNQVGLSDEKSYKPIGVHKFKYEVEKKYGHKYLGVGLDTKLKYHGFYYDVPSYVTFFQEHGWRSALYYYWTNPEFRSYKFHVKVTPAKTRKTQKFITTFQLKTFFAFDGKTYQPVHALEDKDFDAYASKYPIRRPSTVSVVSEFKTVGDVERKIDSEFVYRYSFNWLYHSYGFVAKRSPFLKDETETKVCMEGSTKFPDVDWKKFWQLKTSELDYKVNGKLNLMWGRDCTSDKKITITSISDRTEEQKEYEESLPKYKDHYKTKKYPYVSSYPHPPQLGYNPYADLYYNCLHVQSIGHTMSRYCLEYANRVTQLLKCQSTIKYQNIPEYFSNLTMKTLSWINYKVYPHIDFYYNPSKINRPKGEITTRTNYSAMYPVFDTEMELPNANIHYNRVYNELFYPVSTVYPYAFRTGYLEHYYTNYKHLTYSPCTFDKLVTTFSNSTYQPTFSNCYHVLAKDCTDANRYTVLLARSSEDPKKKNLKIILKRNTVEVLTVGGNMKVRVDGKRVPVSATKPYVLHYEETDGSKRVELYVTYHDIFYIIRDPHTGLHVLFDGHNGAVFLSNYYRGKQCGMCGSMNGRKDHTDFFGPKKCYYSNMKDFSYSYAVRTTQCIVPDFKRPEACEGVKTSKDGRVGCIKHRNRIIYDGTSKNPKVCFSLEPMPECDKRCKPTKILSKKIKFHCLNVGDKYAKLLISERDNRVMTEISRKQPDTEASVDYPEKCVFHKTF